MHCQILQHPIKTSDLQPILWQECMKNHLMCMQAILIATFAAHKSSSKCQSVTKWSRFQCGINRKTCNRVAQDAENNLPQFSMSDKIILTLHKEWLLRQVATYITVAEDHQQTRNSSFNQFLCKMIKRWRLKAALVEKLQPEQEHIQLISHVITSKIKLQQTLHLKKFTRLNCNSIVRKVESVHVDSRN